MGYAANEKRLNALTTDLYQLTMAQGFFNKGKAEKETSYYMHWRTPPFKNAKYSVAAGLEEFIDYLDNFKFTNDDIAYLASIKKKGQPLFTPEFLDYLKNMKLKIDVDALPEGTIIASAGPIVRVTGPLVQCQIIESMMLNIINRNSIIATRSSMIHEVANGIGYALFGLRRAAEIGLGNIRAGMIGGASLTADVDAGRQLGVPVTGTMAHAWIMNFQDETRSNYETELEAFKTYLEEMPNNTVLLVDTYNSKQGIRNAIRAAIETGIELDGVRLDSGELADLTWFAKLELDEARKSHPELFKNTKVFMTDGLEEVAISKLLRKLDGLHQDKYYAPFPRNELALGIGTELANTGPFRGGVYKVCSYVLSQTAENGTVSKVIKAVMKIAGVNTADAALPSSKASIPGEKLDIVRLWRDKQIVAEMIIDKGLGNWQEMLRQGKAISMADNKTEVQIPEFDKVETLLVSVLKRDKDGLSENVFEGPPKKKLEYNGKEVTDLMEIQKLHLLQKAALPESVRNINGSDKLLVLIDPAIHKRRVEIIARTNAEQTPQKEAHGAMEAVNTAQQNLRQQ